MDKRILIVVGLLLLAVASIVAFKTFNKKGKKDNSIGKASFTVSNYPIGNMEYSLVKNLF